MLNRVSVLVACLVVLLGSPTVPTLHAQDSSYTTQEIKDALALSKARAHLLAATAVWQGGQYAFAATHAGHAKAEAYSIQDDLKAKNADVALNNALDAFFALAGQSGDATKFKEASDKALSAIQDALHATVGTVLSEPKFHAILMDKLVHAVEADYEAAYKDGKIVEPVEYQDAEAFFQVAVEYWGDLTSSPETMPKYAASLAVCFANLGFAMPFYLEPPIPPVKPQDVENAIDCISEALRLGYNLPVEAVPSGNEAIDMTRTAVATALLRYKAGEADQAYEAAASAYLDHFEPLEGDLRKKDSTLVDTLEAQFKDFRDGIKAGKPAAGLEVLAAQIDANLDKAAALLAAN